MVSVREKALAFRRLHSGGEAFIIPNPYDVGTAVILEQLGFKALATTSSGFAFSRGLQDNHINRDQMIVHVRDIVSATSLPVSADLENGFFDSPEEVANTIKMAGAAGLAGGSIEDSTNGSVDEPLYSLGQAKDRMVAAVEAKAGLSNDFVLTARAENFLVGRGSVDDVIARLQAYQEAGADVLYAPGLSRLEDVVSIVSNVDLPVNVLARPADADFSAAKLSAVGVKRISVGGALARAALGAFVRASREMLDEGTFDFGSEAIAHADIQAMFEDRSQIPSQK